MKKRTLLSLIILSAVNILFVTCNDPVFYTIAQEMKPISPLISGSTSNMVSFNGNMYLAQSRNLWEYNSNNNPVWKPAGQDNFMLQLATDGNYLYALCFQNRSSGIRTFIGVRDKSGIWTYNDEIPDRVIQSIYSAGDILFIGTRRINDSEYFEVFHAQGTSISTDSIKGISGELTGAVHDGTHYFLSTKQGIYKFTDTDDANLGLVSGSDDKVFTGIIELNTNYIVAITRGGDLHYVTASGLNEERIDGFNGFSTGALTIWVDRNNDANKLLLAGRTFLSTGVSTGYTYGYLEIELDSAGGIKHEARFREPGLNSISSVNTGGNDRYKSTIGRQPVMHIFQAPYEIDEDRILFASTQRNGLWSYRERSGVFHWNAEHLQ